jgi:streptogramin lyase
MGTSLAPSLFAALAVGVLMCILGGCSSSFAPEPSEPGQSEISNISGIVHGGQSPIVGAHVYVYAVGTTGYLSAAKSLLTAGSTTTVDGSGNYYVTTNSGGGFSITGAYTCPSGSLVYLVSYGGNSGSGSFNTGIAQLADLGKCGGTIAPFISVSEISTVVMAYALQGFGTNAYNISSAGTTLAQTGIANAFANITNIMSVSTGYPYTSTVGNSNSVIPYSKIISLANILGACVNTASNTSTACTMLFSLAKRGGVNASDEASAIFNIAHNPTANINALYALIPTTPAFGGGLTSAPADFTIPIVYNSVVSKPNNIAFDATGNAWISDSTKKAVVEVGPQGVVHTYTNGGTFGAISTVAVAPASSGAIWAADFTNNRVYRLNSSGGLLNTITNGGLSRPGQIAFDRSGNAFVVSSGNFNISKYSSSGGGLSTPTYSTSLVTSVAAAVDFSGNVYTPTNGGAAGIGSLEAGQTAGYYYPDFASGSQLNSGTGIALDSTSNVATTTLPSGTLSNVVWQAVAAGRLIKLNLVDFSSTSHQAEIGAVIEFSGGLSGSSLPATISVDGAGSLWVANAGANIVSGFTNAGTALTANGFPTGAATSSLNYAAAADGSGNVWTANSDGTVTQLLGLSVPVATPILPGQFGIMP